jgi:hypothetical protein
MAHFGEMAGLGMVNPGHCSHSQRTTNEWGTGKKENGAGPGGSRRELVGLLTPRRIVATGCRQFTIGADVPPLGFLSLAAVQPADEQQSTWECSADEFQF